MCVLRDSVTLQCETVWCLLKGKDKWDSVYPQQTVRQCVSSEYSLNLSRVILWDKVCVLKCTGSQLPETVCVFTLSSDVRVSETVCVLRDSETVCVLRDSVCQTKAHYRGHILGFKRDSHQESSSLPLVLLVNNRFRSCVLELFISFTHIIMSWSPNIFLPNATRGRCNLHIDTIPDVLPAFLPALSSCDWVSFILDHMFVLLWILWSNSLILVVKYEALLSVKLSMSVIGHTQ